MIIKRMTEKMLIWCGGKLANIREGLNEKKRFLSGIAQMRGGLPMPEFLALFQEVHF